MGKRYLNLKDISSYKIAFELSNHVWKIVGKWDHFSKTTIGKQLTESTDSISANIAEGFGHYFKKDKIKFYQYSQGSLSEVSDWVEKANVRGSLKKEDYSHIAELLALLPKEINYLIKFTDEKLSI